MTPRFPSTPLAIVMAGLFVGAGLYFGLSRRDEIAARPSENVATGAAGIDSDRTRRGAEPAAAATAMAKPTVNVSEEVVRAIELQRPALLAKCWAPAAKATPLPSAVTGSFNFTFDAQGNQIARGVREDRGASRPDVSRCIAETLAPLQIPATGAPSTVEVPFRLP